MHVNASSRVFEMNSNISLRISLASTSLRKGVTLTGSRKSSRNSMILVLRSHFSDFRSFSRCQTEHSRFNSAELARCTSLPRLLLSNHDRKLSAAPENQPQPIGQRSLESSSSSKTRLECPVYTLNRSFFGGAFQQTNSVPPPFHSHVPGSSGVATDELPASRGRGSSVVSVPFV
jgi:hypothetical protein